MQGLEAEISNDVFSYIGKEGRVQKQLFLAAVIALLGSSFPLMIASYMAPDPVTTCGDPNAPLLLQACSEAQACANRDEGRPFSISFPYPNWTQQYNMVCENAGKRQFAKSLFIFVINITATAILLLTDYCGRRLGFFLIFLSALLGTAGGLILDSYTWKFIAYGVASASYNAYSSLFTIAFSELLPSESPMNAYVVAGTFAAGPAGSILYSLLMLILKPETTVGSVYGWVTLVTTVVTFFVPVLIVPESPIYLLKQKALTKFCQVVKEIRNKNKLPPSPELHASLKAKAEDLCNLQRRAGNQDAEIPVATSFLAPIKQILGSWRSAGLILGTAILGGVLLTIYYTIILNLTILGSGDTSLNGILLNTIGIVSNLAFTRVAAKLPHKQWLRILLACFVFGGVLLVVFGKMGMLDGHNTGQKLLNLFITVGIIGIPSFVIFAPSLIYISQNFPTEVSGTATSVIFLISNCLALGTPQIAKYSEEHYGHFASAIALSAFVPLIILKFQASNTDR